MGITFSQVQAGAYALILSENKGTRRIPIIIGTAEAQSIAIYLENLKPPRPLSHDLFISLAENLGMSLKEAFIYKYDEGIFYSDLVFTDGQREIHLDARTSDAIAIAIRGEADIFIADEIMDEVSIDVEGGFDEEEEDADDAANNRKTFENMNVNDLRFFLDEAVGAENYERASYLKDLIDKKSKRKK
jgi:bifunctional DNase/RNase